MPTFISHNVLEIVRGIKAPLKLDVGLVRDEVPNMEQQSTIEMGLGHFADALPQVVGVGCGDKLVVIYQDVPLPRDTQHRAHEVVYFPVYPGGIDQVPAAREVLDVLLAGKLGTVVGAVWVRLIEGFVRPVAPPVEDVVGADVQEITPPCLA